MNYNELASKYAKFNKKIFTGNSPPEIFVGRNNYPDIYAGILSPIDQENHENQNNTKHFSSPEAWFEKQASIKEILDYRRQMIYSRFHINVKKFNNPQITDPILKKSMDQIAMASKSVRAEFSLKKLPKFAPIKDISVPLIGNPAPLEKIRLEENPKIEKKIDYISSDNKLKSVEGIKELYKSQIEISNISKVLSAGLLGIKTQRKMVPTRWAITAVDNTLSKELLEKIKLFPEINEIQLFSGNYVGNHYNILLLPDKFSFEVIEISLSNQGVWQDYEPFSGRKNYAESVTGAYYANRLALSEYLTKIKRQASCLFFREIRPEYSAPLGVGILRELSRASFNKPPKSFPTIKEALDEIQSNIKQPITNYTDKSIILREHGKQKRLNQWFN